MRFKKMRKAALKTWADPKVRKRRIRGIRAAWKLKREGKNGNAGRHRQAS